MTRQDITRLGVISYTPDPVKMIREIHRILKDNGFAWLDFYNSLGWAFEYDDIDFKIDTAPADERLIQMPDWDYPAGMFLPGYPAGLLTKNGFEIDGFFANGILLNSFSVK
jgi:SAM-dependent methyltransferase